MKLIHCKDCGDIVLIYPKNIVRSCLCRKVAGKYLSNCVTAIVTENAIVLGIDNNGFNLANKIYEHNQEIEKRVDIFFTGWIPNFPGEVIKVPLFEDVVNYSYETDIVEESTLATNHKKESDNIKPKPIPPKGKSFSGKKWFDGVRKSLFYRLW